MIRKILTIAICLFLAACNMPQMQQITAQPQVWFDMPLPETVLYPSNPCEVVAHGASPNGIALFELSINESVAASLPNSDTQKTLATLNYNCSLQQPGRNTLKLRVKDSSGVWSEYTQTTVILAGDVPLPASSVTETAPPRPTEMVVATFTAVPTLTPTLIPTFTPTSPPTGSIVIEQISANPVYIGRSDCGPLDETITARVFASTGIAAVVLFYRFEPGSPSGEFQNISMSSIGGDLYQGTINTTSVFGGSVPFDQATLQYQIVIQDINADTSIRTPLLADIFVRACTSVVSACSPYTDERTCIANSCRWGPIAGTRQIGCQNP